MSPAITNLKNLANKYSVGMLCGIVLDSPAFQSGIASAGHHPLSHQTEGGLPIHTLEVARAATNLAAASAFGDAKLERLVFIAAVFHDFGKIREYKRTEAGIVRTEFAREVGHIPYGYAFFTEQARGYLTMDDTNQIGHAILAHHGTRAWGSVVEPQTKLALLLHTADMLSAKGWV